MSVQTDGKSRGLALQDSSGKPGKTGFVDKPALGLSAF
jgi:hypothetical protein